MLHRRYRSVITKGGSTTKIASGVQKSDEAFALAKQGVTAVSGSAVSPPLGVDQMRVYLGPAEAGLETIRADSL